MTKKGTESGRDNRDNGSTLQDRERAERSILHLYGSMEPYRRAAPKDRAAAGYRDDSHRRGQPDDRGEGETGTGIERALLRRETEEPAADHDSRRLPDTAGEEAGAQLLFKCR